MIKCRPVGPWHVNVGRPTAAFYIDQRIMWPRRLIMSRMVATDAWNFLAFGLWLSAMPDSGRGMQEAPTGGPAQEPVLRDQRLGGLAGRGAAWRDIAILPQLFVVLVDGAGFETQSSLATQAFANVRRVSPIPAQPHFEPGSAEDATAMRDVGKYDCSWRPR